MWKPFGTWSAASSFSLGGIAGVIAGGITLAGLATVGLPASLLLFYVLGTAALVGFGVGLVIHGANNFKGATDKAIKPKVQTRTVAEKVLTGAVVTGYVALSVVTVSNVAKTPVEVTPIASEMVEVAPIASETVIEPTIAPNTETPAPTPDLYGCDNPQLTPEEKSNCGEHTYVFVEYNRIKAVNDSNPPCQTTFDSPRKLTFSFGGDFSKKRESENKYLVLEIGTTTKQYYIFTQNGFISYREYLDPGYYCTDEVIWAISE